MEQITLKEIVESTNHRFMVDSQTPERMRQESEKTIQQGSKGWRIQNVDLGNVMQAPDPATSAELAFLGGYDNICYIVNNIGIFSPDVCNLIHEIMLTQTDREGKPGNRKFVYAFGEGEENYSALHRELSLPEIPLDDLCQRVNPSMPCTFESVKVRGNQASSGIHFPALILKAGESYTEQASAGITEGMVSVINNAGLLIDYDSHTPMRAEPAIKLTGVYQGNPQKWVTSADLYLLRHKGHAKDIQRILNKSMFQDYIEESKNNPGIYPQFPIICHEYPMIGVKIGDDPAFPILPLASVLSQGNIIQFSFFWPLPLKVSAHDFAHAFAKKYESNHPG